jgi:hypothetical protein
MNRQFIKIGLISAILSLIQFHVHAKGGYDTKNPKGIYTNENPYGPSGQFRTIDVYYNIDFRRFIYLDVK